MLHFALNDKLLQVMNSPSIDQNNWLEQYTRMLELLIERNSGDFLLSAFAADIQEAWLRAMEHWQKSPERYSEVKQQWDEALTGFNASISSAGHNPLKAIKDLKILHAALGRYLNSIVENTPELNDGDRQLLNFGVRHIISAMDPEFWPAANADVVKAAMETNGGSFIQGMQNFYDDISKSVIGLDVKTAGENDFVLGETIATTPGEIVYENDIFQLIQYYPFSQKVFQHPLLIVPPWINKFYVLDLNPSDSFVHWAVRQGHTVFMISWVNPDDRHRHLGLADYLVDGCLQAVEVVKKISGQRSVNLAGYCIGGMLAACATAYLAGENNSIRTLTLFNTMLDYSDPGEIGVFLSERMLSALDDEMKTRGIMDGRIMRQAFTMLREDRMFWPFVVNNYFLGRSPEPNPVLFWNQDATNLPYPMLKEFLTDMYINNTLVDEVGYMLAGKHISLQQVDVPVYALACRNDRIIPWQSAFNSTLHFSGEVCFVLSDSGHVMGVINPPGKKRSGFWSSGNGAQETAPHGWLENAGHHEGSWWPHWHDWLAGRQPDLIGARFPGGEGIKIIESAPGRYVKG